MSNKSKLLFGGALLFIGAFSKVQAQKTTVVDSTGKNSIIVIPGKQYKRSGLHGMLWGPQWRKEWSTPVRVNVLNMDTAYGGLKAIKKAGGKQTKNLRLEAASGREYAIRSVDKNYGKSIPEEFQGTFLQKIVDDQMSSSYPYAGLVIKKLAAAAHIYSTNPSLYFVKQQPRLDSFNNEYGDLLYFLEDRPGSPNAKYYGAEKIEEASDLFEDLQKDPYKKVDQTAYAKARLFDLMIGDWDRHFDQWVWAKKEAKGDAIYFPMPKDRDQAMSSYDGFLLKTITKSAKLTMLQPFRDNLKDVEGYTWVYRNFDAALTNEVSLETWLAQANELKTELTDEVIANAVKEVPSEVYPISGAELTRILKARRDQLEIFAQAFYESLSKEPVVLGSDGNDRIEVINQSPNSVQLNLYAEKKDKPFYSRVFNDAETKEIRVYGMKGADQFSVAPDKTNGIIVRLIGGPDKDKYNVPSSASKIVVYDDKENDLASSSAKFHPTKDTMLFKFDGKSMKRDEIKIKPLLGYTNEDRIYVGLGLTASNYTFMDEPFTSKNSLSAKYSITQKAFSFAYKGMFRNIIRKIDLGLFAEYDLVRDQDFLGVGNNTVKSSDVRQYYRYRNKEANASISLIGNISKHQTFTVFGAYQMVQLYNDAGKYISLNYIPTHSQVLDAQHFIGGGAAYDLNLIGNEAVPKGGMRLHAAFDHMQNTDNKKIVNKVSSWGGFILPLGALSLSSKIGASKIWGEPEFYQLNRIGSGNTLRGYLRFRLYGNSAVYNQNELQWTFNVKSYLFNGKAGIIALMDNGRVWVPGEVSDKWYSAFGGGFMIAPFNKISVAVTYAVSDEGNRISLRAGHLLSR